MDVVGSYANWSTYDLRVYFFFFVTNAVYQMPKCVFHPIISYFIHLGCPRRGGKEEEEGHSSC